jgi:PAS domain S-box-containing protein
MLLIYSRTLGSDNEELMFGENSFSCIIVISTDYKDMGIIEYANEEVIKLMGYTPKELLGKDINTIIPHEIAKVHTKLMVKFFDKAESIVLNNIRQMFI